MGSPRELTPHGTEIPGIPARLAEMVKMSDRYMVRGSASFSPRRNGGVGDTGQAIRAHSRKAESKSPRIRARGWVPFR